MYCQAAIFYAKNKTKRGAVYGLMLGIISKVVMGSITNYYIIIPLYQHIIPLEQIIGMAAKANTKIVDVKTYILYAVVPFNLIQSLVISAITLLIYKKISPILHK